MIVMYFQTDESGRWLPQPRPQGQFYLQNQSLFGGAQVTQPFLNQPSKKVPHQIINSSAVAPMPSSCAPIYNTMEEPKLEELEEFAETFKQKRISLGLSQAEVSTSMRKLYAQDISHETISRFENLNLSFRSMSELKPWLQKWLMDVSNRPTNTRSSSFETVAQKKHKRTHFASDERDALEKVFSQDPKPSNTEIVTLAQNLGIDTQVVKNWFNNRRSKEKKMLNGTQMQPQKMHTTGNLSTAALERAFNQKPYPTPEEFGILAESLGMDNECVRYWFYNRRRKEKKNLPTLGFGIAK